MRHLSMAAVAICLTILLTWGGADGSSDSDAAGGSSLYQQESSFYAQLLEPSLYEQQNSLYNTMIEDKQMLAHAKAISSYSSTASYSSATAAKSAGLKKALKKAHHKVEEAGKAYVSASGAAVDERKKSGAEAANSPPIESLPPNGAYSSAVAAATHKAALQLKKSHAARIAALKVLDAAKGQAVFARINPFA